MLSYIILNIFYFISLISLVNLYKRTIIHDETQKALQVNSKGIFIPKNSCYNELYIDSLCRLKNNNLHKYIGILPFSDRIVSKNGLWLLMKSSYSKKVLDKYFPKTFILQEWNDRLEFNKLVYSAINHKSNNNKNNNKSNNIFIIKKNVNCKLGLKLFTIKDVNDLSDLYIKYFQDDYKLVQQFLPNPFLINNRILICRVYIFIYKQYLVDTKQLTIYRFNWLKCLYPNKDFDINNYESLISDSHNINYGFPLYFNKNDNNKLFRKLDISLKMLGVAVKETFLENNILENHNQFQLFGLDYILDQNENPYLLEINKGPNLQNYYSDYEKKMKKMLVYQMHDLVRNDIGSKDSNYDISFSCKISF